MLSLNAHVPWCKVSRCWIFFISATLAKIKKGLEFCRRQRLWRGKETAIQARKLNWAGCVIISSFDLTILVCFLFEIETIFCCISQLPKSNLFSWGKQAGLEQPANTNPRHPQPASCSPASQLNRAKNGESRKSVITNRSTAAPKCSPFYCQYYRF